MARASKKITKILLEGLAGLFALGFLLTLFVFWRAPYATISVSGFIPALERHGDDVLAPLRVSIQSAHIYYEPEDGLFVLNLRGLTLFNPTSGQTTLVRALDADLYPSDLFSGTIAPRGIYIAGAGLTLETGEGRPKGCIGIFLCPQGKRETAPEADTPNLITQFISDILIGENPHPRLAALEEVRIQDVRLVASTQQLRNEAEETIAVSFERGAAGLSVHISGEAEGSAPWYVHFDGGDFADRETAQLNARIENMPVNLFGLFFPDLGRVLSLDMNVDGRLALSLNENGAVENGLARVRAQRGRLGFPAFSKHIYDFENVQIVARLDAERSLFEIEDLVYYINGQRARYIGRASYAAPTTETETETETPETGPPTLFDIWLNGKNVHLALPGAGFRLEPVAILNAEMRLDARAGSVDIISLATRVWGGDINLKGRILAKEEGLGLRGTADLKNIPLDKLSHLFPENVASRTHEWLTENILAGRITHGIVDLDTELPEDRRVSLMLNVANARLFYGKLLPPLSRASGQCTLRMSKFQCTIPRARAEASITGETKRAPLRLSNLSFDIDNVREPNPDKRLKLDAKGDISSVLSLLSHIPKMKKSLRLFEETSGASQVSGTAIITGDTEKFGFDNLDLDLVGKIDDFTAHIISFDIAKGQVAMVFKGNDLSFDGHLNIGSLPTRMTWRETFRKGVPIPQEPDITQPANAKLHLRREEEGRFFLGEDAELTLVGPLDTSCSFWRSSGPGTEMHCNADISETLITLEDLGWQTDKSPNAHITAWARLTADSMNLKRFRVETEKVHIQGEAMFGKDAKILSVRLPVVRIGKDTDIRLGMSRGRDDTLHIQVEGPRFDLRRLIERLPKHLTRAFTDADAGETGQTEEGGQTQWRLDATIEEGIAHNGILLEKSAIKIGVDENRDLKELALNATMTQGGKVKATLDRLDTGRRMRFVSDDAGNALRAMNVYPNLLNGELDLQVIWSPDTPKENPKPKQKTKGLMRIKDFTISDAPVFAEVLTAGELKEAVDALRQSGIAFTRLHVPFSFSGGRLNITDGRLHGPSLGFTLSGEYAPDVNKVAMKGTLTPAYTLNSLIGNVPIIGRLVGRKGEGILGITFSVDGDISRPRVRVNPLSMLAPGFLRRLFELNPRDIDAPSPEG